MKTFAEFTDELNELSTDTLKSYKRKATVDLIGATVRLASFEPGLRTRPGDSAHKTAVELRSKRNKGLHKANDRLYKEEVDEALSFNENWEKSSPKSQEKVNRARVGMKVKTPDGDGTIHMEYKKPTFSKLVPYVHEISVKFADGARNTYRHHLVKPIKESEDSLDEGSVAGTRHPDDIKKANYDKLEKKFGHLWGTRHPDDIKKANYESVKESEDIDNNSPFVRIKAAKHPDATENHLTKAMNDVHPSVRYAAIHHKNATADHITTAMKDGEWTVRVAALGHKNVTTDHIKSGLGDKDASVRRAAKERMVSNSGKVKSKMDEDVKKVHESDIDEAFKLVPAHSASGVPNPNHPSYSTHKAKYDADKKAHLPAKAGSAEKSVELHHIDAAIGDSYPDTDPYDHLARKFPNLHKQDGKTGSKLMDQLHAVTKKQGKSKDFHDYVNQIHRQFKMDEASVFDWKKNKSEIISEGGIKNFMNELEDELIRLGCSEEEIDNIYNSSMITRIISSKMSQGVKAVAKVVHKLIYKFNESVTGSEDIDEASVFDWKKNKSEIDWNDKKDEPTVSKDGGMVHKARTTDRNPETGGAKDPLNVGRPKGKYGMYKIDKATRDDPEYKKTLSQKVMAAKKDGFEARTDFKTSLNAAIKKRQEELWAKAK